MDKSEKIEAYYEEEHLFKEAITQLRELVIKTDLEETFKWMFPTYTLNGKNVLAICKFKGHFGIWFFNGVFLSDSKNVLENAQEGKTQAMRHWKFKSRDEIKEKMVSAYINEAIENERKGIRLAPKKKQAIVVVLPKELKIAFENNPDLKKAFHTLSPSRQKEYAEYISGAKREQTKEARLLKIPPMILEGKGLNDKYR
ncbi:hypothetical protein EJ994_08140 [Maribacter sp. MJ134]|uniref:YdeI/OmpD-associated family protein n=1 Tax=Maribacter sp. MJ134 TaxID=2496865 RepID=UPI000F847671|nr:DUF1801 domain-containing protein [Maribacter sp. MJ134]AZQ58776.1 hypothetical protein EJ994_08140 [Maribacter sp. MJ134]